MELKKVTTGKTSISPQKVETEGGKSISTGALLILAKEGTVAILPLEAQSCFCFTGRAL